MELRQYWSIIVRRWYLVGGLTLLAFALSLASLTTLPQPSATYQATARIAVRPAADERPRTDGYGEYYKYIASEYLNDDVIETIKSSAFMTAIQERNAQRPGGPPSGSIEAKKAHRVIVLTVHANDGEDALLIANTTVALLSEPAPGKKTSKYFADLTTEQDPTVTVIDPPSLTVQPGGSRGALDLAVRTLLGLFAGVALAFLLDYLDDTLRDGGDATVVTGLPVLGEIPPERPRRRRLLPKRAPA